MDQTDRNELYKCIMTWIELYGHRMQSECSRFLRQLSLATVPAIHCVVLGPIPPTEPY